MRAGILGILLCTQLSVAAHSQTPTSKPGLECIRINDNPNGLGDWNEHERNRKAWIETCKQALALEGSNMRLKSAMARALSSDGRRAEAIALWRELGDAGDADALHEIYDTFKSYDRSENGKAKLVTRVEAEAALRKAAELGRPYSMWILAVLLDRGSTVKRDPAGAIAWAQRAMANPPQDTTRADIETRLGHFLAKSNDAEQRNRGLAILERHATARADAKAYLALALRRQDPIRARKLLEAALKGAPGHAIPALTEMMLRGEGGPKDEKRALSLLQGRTASDVAAVRAALGRLQVEGRLVPKNVAQGIGLIRGEAAWSQEVQIEVMGLLAANPEVSISGAESFLYDAIEAAELDEPGMLPALLDLKLSQNKQFMDKKSACLLIDRYAAQGRQEALSRRKSC